MVLTLYHKLAFYSVNLELKQFCDHLISFQKWPRTDIGPVEALLVIFANEKRTGDSVNY